jgi:transcriptional regulator with PAS, ATPase and Fis domain
LLRVLEERTVTAVGADRPQAIDVRVIAATNVAPSTLRNKDQFRQDLVFRLNTVEITVPPLRDRPDDVLPIAEHFLAIYARKYSVPNKSFSPQAEAALLGYEWPGNVRALRHSIERAVILSRGSVIEAEDLQLQHGAETTSPERQDSALNLEHVEKETIAAALRKHGFNISHAARELGLTRASLYRRMEKHGL